MVHIRLTNILLKNLFDVGYKVIWIVYLLSFLKVLGWYYMLQDGHPYRSKDLQQYPCLNIENLT